MLETVSDCMLVNGVGDSESEPSTKGNADEAQSSFRDWEKADMIFVKDESYTVREEGKEGKRQFFDTWAYLRPDVLIHSAVNRDYINGIRNLCDKENIPIWSVSQKPYITSGDFQYSNFFMVGS